MEKAEKMIAEMKADLEIVDTLLDTWKAENKSLKYAIKLEKERCRKEQAKFKALEEENKRLREEFKEERKLGIDVMLALEDCIEHFDDSNWPDDCGYSKADLEKAVKKYNEMVDK